MRRVLALALLAAGIGACAGSPPPDDAFHRLSPPEPARRSAPLLAGSVEVARFSASDALRGRAMMLASEERPDRLQRSHHHFWADAPPVLLQRALMAHLRAAGAAGEVVDPERRAGPAWRVTGRIERFERVLGGGGGRVEVALELSLRETGGAKRSVAGRYAVREPISRNSADEAVAAFGRAVAGAFDAFLAELEAGLR